MMSASKCKTGQILHGRKFAWQVMSKSYLKKKAVDDGMNCEIQFEFPGWKQISNKRKGLSYKSVWSLIIVFSVCLCGYQIADRIELFASKPISTEIVVQKNDSVKFPSFVACPNSHTLQKIVPLQQQLAQEKGVSFCDVKFTDVLARFNFSVLKLWSFFEIDSLLKDPIFVEWIIDYDKRNTSRFMKTNVTTIHGTCKKISFPELVPFRKEASTLAILAKDYYIHCGRNPVAFNVYVRAGDDQAKYHPLSDTIGAQHYFSLTYGVSARQYMYLNTEKNPCSDFTTVNTCLETCYKKIAFANVTCKMPGLDFETHLPVCTSYHQYYKNLEHVVFKTAMINYRVNCNCPRLCEEIVYKFELKSMVRKGVTEVAFYFEDNQIDLMREYYSYTVIPLLCDLGGNLGLFLGLCIPSVLENIENAILYLKRKMF